jgi:hypothetical protein
VDQAAEQVLAAHVRRHSSRSLDGAGYVASTTLTEARWADTTVLSGDLAAAMMNLLIIPVVVGQGTRLFPDSGPDLALDLVESRAFPKGITIQVYRPAGRPQYATD